VTPLQVRLAGLAGFAVITAHSPLAQDNRHGRTPIGMQWHGSPRPGSVADLLI